MEIFIVEKQGLAERYSIEQCKDIKKFKKSEEPNKTYYMFNRPSNFESILDHVRMYNPFYKKKEAIKECMKTLWMTSLSRRELFIEI